MQEQLPAHALMLAIPFPKWGACSEGPVDTGLNRFGGEGRIQGESRAEQIGARPKLESNSEVFFSFALCLGGRALGWKERLKILKSHAREINDFGRRIAPHGFGPNAPVAVLCGNMQSL